MVGQPSTLQITRYMFLRQLLKSLRRHLRKFRKFPMENSVLPINITVIRVLYKVNALLYMNILSSETVYCNTVTSTLLGVLNTQHRGLDHDIAPNPINGRCITAFLSQIFTACIIRSKFQSKRYSRSQGMCKILVHN